MHLARVASRTLLILPAAAVILAAPLIGAAASPPMRAERSTASAGLPGPGSEEELPTHTDSPARPYPRNPAQVRIEHVAHEGEQAFGLPEGVTFSYLAGGQIDCLGNVLFKSWLSGPGVTTANDWAIFYGQPGSITKVIQESDPAPCMPEGVIVSSLYYAVQRLSETAPGCVSDDEPGWISLTIDVSGPGITPGVNDRIFYVGPPDDLQPVLRGGDQAPGCEPGVYTDVSSLAGFGGTLSDHATMLVCAQLAGPGVTAWNDWACWTGTRESLQLAVRMGMQAPDCPAGVTFRYPDLLAHNDAGQLVFRAGLRGSGVTSLNDYGRWMFQPGQGLIKIAREGDPVPWFGGTQTWSGIGGALGEVNGLGQTGEVGNIQGDGVTSANDRIFVLGAPPDLDLLGREGDPAVQLGVGVYLADFSNFWINDRSEIFHLCMFGGSGISPSNRCAVYFGPVNARELSLRDGNPAPTFPYAITLAQVASLASRAAMNDTGDVAGPTRIEGPGVVAGVNDVVLWMRHHVLRRWIPLLRSGDLIEGRNTYAGYEIDFAMLASGGADGRAQNFNDRGMVAQGIAFTDGTFGIYRLSPILADANRDGDLDADDWALLPACLDAVGATLSQDCSVFDLNDDGHLNLIDVGMLQELFQDQP